MSIEESLKLTFDSQLYLMSSDEIRVFADTMISSNNRRAIKEFCSWFALDKWYEEALLAHNPNIRDWMLEAADEAELEEAIIAQDDKIMEQSLRESQGAF